MMEKPRSIAGTIIRTVIPLLVMAVAVFGFSAMKKQKAVPKDPEKKQPTLVETITVQSHEKGLDLPVSGIVVPYREISLSAEVAGRVVSKAEEFRTGRFVKKGTELVRLFDKDYQLEVNRLKKDLAQAEATIRELDVELENTQELVKLGREEVDLQQKNLARESRLRGTGAAAERELDDARRAELASRNALRLTINQANLLKTRKNRLITAKEKTAIELEKAELDLKRTTITAPIDGVIITDNAELDSYLTKGKEIAVIEDTSKVEVRCHLRVSELAWLWGSASSEVEVSEEQKKGRAYTLPENIQATIMYQMGDTIWKWSGKLSRYEGSGLEERSRTVPCRVVVENPQDVRTDQTSDPYLSRAPRALMRGMFVTVVFHATPATRLLSVPESAVQPGNVVLKVEDDKLKVVSIQRARTYRGRVLIDGLASSLAQGDRIVVSPLNTIRNGLPVREKSQ